MTGTLTPFFTSPLKGGKTAVQIGHGKYLTPFQIASRAVVPAAVSTLVFILGPALILGLAPFLGTYNVIRRNKSRSPIRVPTAKGTLVFLKSGIFMQIVVFCISQNILKTFSNNFKTCFQKSLTNITNNKKNKYVEICFEIV